MFVMEIMRLFRGNCPQGVHNRTSLEVAMLCNKSEARSLDTALERLHKTTLILGSSSSFQHRNAGLTPFQTVLMPSKKCQRFRFEHSFTSMIAGMTRSGKMAWV